MCKQAVNDIYNGKSVPPMENLPTHEKCFKKNFEIWLYSELESKRGRGVAALKICLTFSPTLFSLLCCSVPLAALLKIYFLLYIKLKHSEK